MLGAYLAGSIPVGIVIARLTGGIHGTERKFDMGLLAGKRPSG